MFWCGAALAGLAAVAASGPDVLVLRCRSAKTWRGLQAPFVDADAILPEASHD